MRRGSLSGYQPLWFASSASCCVRMRETATSITVRVFNPRKSHLTSPASVRGASAPSVTVAGTVSASAGGSHGSRAGRAGGR